MRLVLLMKEALASVIFARVSKNAIVCFDFHEISTLFCLRAVARLIEGDCLNFKKFDILPYVP